MGDGVTMSRPRSPNDFVCQNPECQYFQTAPGKDVRKQGFNSASHQRYWYVDGDTDSDGLADLWERTYFGDLTPEGDNDPDDDERTNAEEFPCGTDPNDPDSHFDITSICLNGEGIELEIKTVKGWRYTVLYADTPDSSDWHVCGTIIGDGTTMTVIDTASSGLQERYYRVLTE